MVPWTVLSTVAAVTATGNAAGGDAAEKGFGPGLPGFLIVFFLAVAVYLLFRSMTRHLRKVRYGPDPAADEGEGPGAVEVPGDAGTVDSAGAADAPPPSAGPSAD